MLYVITDMLNLKQMNVYKQNRNRLTGTENNKDGYQWREGRREEQEKDIGLGERNYYV